MKKEIVNIVDLNLKVTYIVAKYLWMNKEINILLMLMVIKYMLNMMKMEK